MKKTEEEIEAQLLTLLGSAVTYWIMHIYRQRKKNQQKQDAFTYK